MNGHGLHHGVLLLQDLEDDDLEYQTSYSSTNTNEQPSTSLFQRKLEKDSLQVPKNPKLLLVPPTNPSPISTSPNPMLNYSRRKSISAEPPWNIPPHSDKLVQYQNQNGYLFSKTNSTISHLAVPPFEGEERDNAITVVPSRNSHLDPNVFAGGRDNPNNNNHHHHKKHNHRKHKGRSKSPGRNSQLEGGSDHGVGGGCPSILDRIDNSILKKFGDWSNIEDDGRPQRGIGGGVGDNIFRSNSNNTNNSKTLPYYFPRRMGSQDEEVCGNGVSGAQLGLPKLFKNYDTVVKNSKQVLTDKSSKIALSKDNNDPNSILSEAKRTLSRFGGQEFD